MISFIAREDNNGLWFIAKNTEESRGNPLNKYNIVDVCTVYSKLLKTHTHTHIKRRKYEDRIKRTKKKKKTERKEINRKANGK